MLYNYLKLIHIFSVMLFLGNIITGLFWMRFAVKTRDLKIVTYSMRSIIRLDRYFTIPGVILITTFGILAAVYGHLPLLHTGWILWSIIMFSLSGIAFGFKVAPLQKKIYQLTQGKENAADFDWPLFHKLLLQWDIWALVATLTPLAAFVMMTLKIPL